MSELFDVDERVQSENLGAVRRLVTLAALEAFAESCSDDPSSCEDWNEMAKEIRQSQGSLYEP